MRFYYTGNIAWAFETAWDLAIPAIFLFSGWAARLGRFAARVAPNRTLQTGLFWILFGVIFALADLPVLFFRSYMRSHWFGLSEQPLPDWIADVFKEAGIEIALGLVAVWVGLYLIRRFPKNWWLACSTLALPLLLALVFLQPLVFEPLFNRFEPLQDKGLETKILALAESAGLEHPAVFQVNRSKQTKALNAYVSGLFGSARIVLWDTLFPKLSQREILSIVAHEVGHRVLHHLIKGTFVLWLLVTASLWGCSVAAPVILSKWGSMFQFTSLSEPAAIPLLVFLLLAAIFIVTPIGFAYSRHVEAEADRFALELTHDNHAGASSQLKLSLQNLSNPRPGWLFVLFRATHPPDAERIEFFNNYKPWETGEPLRYRDLIKPQP